LVDAADVIDARVVAGFCCFGGISDALQSSRLSNLLTLTFKSRTQDNNKARNNQQSLTRDQNKSDKNRLQLLDSIGKKRIEHNGRKTKQIPETEKANKEGNKKSLLKS
jgi:hypothetical protein